MEKGIIPDRAITASSFYNNAHRPPNGRLRFRAGNGRTGAWSSLVNNQGQWFQVDFGYTMKITRVATQGRQDADQWVTSYTLSYSQDGGHFYPYKNINKIQQVSTRSEFFYLSVKPFSLMHLFINLHINLHVKMLPDYSLSRRVMYSDADMLEDNYV